MHWKNYTFVTATILSGLMLMNTACAPGQVGRESGGDPSLVEVRQLPDEERVDVLVGGELFTSYIYLESLAVLKKPVLYPIRSPDGSDVTRGFPIEPREGEQVDHPHQIGLWFTYGDVNGLDFWNNSDAIPPEEAHNYGRIEHRRVLSTESGEGRGALEIEAAWLAPSGEELLQERTRFVFHAGTDVRAIDRITTLTAGDERVLMRDNKEGVIGMRTRRELELATGRSAILVDASGRPGSEEILDEGRLTGAYRNSEGISGYPDVWGQRARWTALSGVLDGDSVTVAIFDHPENVGYPTYWHARDYGLFAANPLGQEAMSEGRESLNYQLDAGESVTFRYRVLLHSGAATDAQIESGWNAFTSAVD